MSEPEPRSPESLLPELKGFEASLAALTPTAAAIDRDRLMYEAGRASRGSTRLPWTVAAVSSGSFCALLTAIILLIASGHSRSGTSVHSTPDVTEEVIASAASPIDPASYAHLRRLFTETDLAALDALPVPAAAADANDRNSLLHELLN